MGSEGLKHYLWPCIKGSLAYYLKGTELQEMVQRYSAPTGWRHLCIPHIKVPKKGWNSKYTNILKIAYWVVYVVLFRCGTLSDKCPNSDLWSLSTMVRHLKIRYCDAEHCAPKSVYVFSPPCLPPFKINRCLKTFSNLPHKYFVYHYQIYLSSSLPELCSWIYYDIHILYDLLIIQKTMTKNHFLSHLMYFC